MTLTADSKKRVVLPGAAPGDVFTYEQSGSALFLKRIYRQSPRRKKTKTQVLKMIRDWKFKPAMTWEELRKLTREP